MKPHQTFLAAPLLFVVLAGCADDAGPRARTPGADLPLELRNDSSIERTVLVRVEEPAGGSALLHQAYRLAAGASGHIDPVRVPFGTYRLGAESGDLGREVEADFEGKDDRFRFVLHDDVIAFQRGGR